MKYFVTFLLLTFAPVVLLAQKPHCQDKRFHKEVARYTSQRVPLIDVDQLKDDNQWIILDARELKEYEISHIPGAKYVGYDDFDLERLSEIDRDQKIAIYCSIGYRSEKIGEKLQKAGFSRVRNVYGSLFEWANRGYQLEDSSGKNTSQIHTYNKKWSRWVLSQDVEKIW